MLFSFLLLACGNSDPAQADAKIPQSRGEMLFDTHCKLCHGEDGKLGMGGAKDLSRSILTKDEITMVIANGQGTMMPFRNLLSTEEINILSEHVYDLSERE
ncbi:MAG: cytochrome c [Bacteroidota bacterium]|nr:cytochrome c [Bacteroidota bacterium]